MIGSEHHFKINGTPFRAAEDAEGDHYILSTPTLRAPNTQLVQGSDSNQVNLNPDTLVWSIDSWAGGEGQVKWTSENKNRAEVIQGLNFFGRPGNLFLGYGIQVTQNSGASAFTDECGLVIARNELYAVGVGAASDDFYVWNESPGWAAGVSIGTTDGARSALAMTGDGNYLFFVKHGTDQMWRWTGSAWANHNDQTGGNLDCQLVASGDYVYKYDVDGKVYELSKVTANTATAETPILDFSSEGTVQLFENRKITAGYGRVYVMATYKYETVIYEIVPTSAATTGYGREIFRARGMRGESCWFHGGFLFWTATDNEVDGVEGARRVLYYLQPGESYGAMGEMRSWVQDQVIPGGIVMMGASRLNTFGIVGSATYSGVTPATDVFDLWEVDAISGGFGVVGTGVDLAPSEQYECTSLEFSEGKIFASVRDKATGNTHGIWFWDTPTYSPSGFAVTPSHDFGIAATKVLQSVETVLEPLPTSGVLTVAYSLDGGSWVNLTANSTDGSTGTREIVSTDAAPKTFKEMQLKVTFGGTSTQTPLLKAVNVRASVNETYKVWQLMLDLSDETSPRGYDGAALQTLLLALNNDTVVAFQDGYGSRAPNSWVEYDVVVESVSIVGSHPGEGYAQVILREVV